jgi:hypothetical protein
MPVAGETRLKRKKMIGLLSEVEAASDGFGSLYLPPNTPSGEIVEMAAKIPGLEPAMTDLKPYLSSPSGVAIFWGEAHHLLVLPPFPVKEKVIFAGYFPEPLRAMLETDFTIGLLLLRLGAYAVGVFEGEKLVSSKVGTGLVHARHRQGGSSAARFRRHREKQAETFFTRVCGHLREHFEPYLGRMDYVVYGGERFTLSSFQKQCDFSGRLAGLTLPYRLDIRYPKQATLDAAIDQVWTSRIIFWQPPDFA